jgi:hypothetical protein
LVRARVQVGDLLVQVPAQDLLVLEQELAHRSRLDRHLGRFERVRVSERELLERDGRHLPREALARRLRGDKVRVALEVVTARRRSASSGR